MGAIAYGFFKLQGLFFKDKTIRSTEADEIAGLDRPEMGVLAYDNLQIREIDVVGLDPSQDKVLATGGESPDPTTGGRTLQHDQGTAAGAGGHHGVPAGFAAAVHVPETLPRPRGNSLHGCSRPNLTCT